MRMSSSNQASSDRAVLRRGTDSDLSPADKAENGPAPTERGLLYPETSLQLSLIPNRRGWVVLDEGMPPRGSWREVSGSDRTPPPPQTSGDSRNRHFSQFILFIHT